MAPLIVLLTVTAAARTIGAFGAGDAASWPAATAVGLAVMFAMTGVAHFVSPRREGLIAIVPPTLPHPQMLVTVTGLLELAGAAALLAPPGWGPVRVGAAWCLTLLLVAMFPANVHASRAQRSPHSPHTPLLPRAAMQCVFVAATLCVALAS